MIWRTVSRRVDEVIPSDHLRIANKKDVRGWMLSHSLPTSYARTSSWSFNHIKLHTILPNWMVVYSCVKTQINCYFSENGDYWSLKFLTWIIISRFLIFEWLNVETLRCLSIGIRTVTCGRQVGTCTVTRYYLCTMAVLGCFALSWVNAFYCDSGDPSTLLISD